MELMSEFFVPFRETVSGYLPRLIPALLILLVGWLLATVARLVVRTLIRSGLRFMEKRLDHYRTIISHGREMILLGFIPHLAYWLLIIIALTIASEVLGLPLFSSWLKELIIYVPHILLAIFVIIVGLVGGSFLKDLMIKTAFRMRIPHGDVLGRVAQSITVVVAVVVAINELGIDISFLTTLVLILLGAFLFASAIAFGMGANTSIRNILACYYLRKYLEVGQEVQIEEVRGVVVEISATNVVLNAEQGRVLIPGKIFSETMSVIVRNKSK